jgi:hypothetical protein
MSVTVLSVIEELRSGGSSNTGGKFTREFVRTFRVEFDSFEATSVDAEDANDGTTSIPAYGSVFGQSGLVVTGKKSRQFEKNWAEWLVDVTYTVPEPGRSDAPAAGKFNVRISGGGVPIAEDTPVYYGEDDAVPAFYHKWTQVVNQAGDIIEPPARKNYYMEELTVEFDTIAPDFAVYESTRGCCNAAAVTMTIWRPGVWNSWATYIAGAYTETQTGGVKFWKALANNSNINPLTPGQTAWEDVTSTFPGKKTYATGRLLADNITYSTVIAANALPATHVTVKLAVRPADYPWDTLKIPNTGFSAYYGEKKHRIGVDLKPAVQPTNPAKSTPTALDNDGKVLTDLSGGILNVSYAGWIKKVSFADLLSGI